MKKFIFNRWVEDLLNSKTQKQEETQGYLICVDSNHTPNKLTEGIFPFDISRGSAGMVVTNEQMAKLVWNVLGDMYDILEYHVHTIGTRKLDPKWDYTLSNFGDSGDMPAIRDAMQKDPNYQHLFVTPACYAFIYADKTAGSGLGALKCEWGSMPLLTSFDWKFNRKALAGMAKKRLEEALK